MNGRMLERDEDHLVLFRELHKRESDRIGTLLQPVSDEFEPKPGSFALYRIASGKKGSGYQFFPDNNKNDYDWLKTPPATPLFPSLEMEANAAQPLLQRELPIIQPISRFAGHKESKTTNIGRPKSPNPKPKIPSRSVTPSYRRPSTEVVKNNTKSAAPTLNKPTNYDPLKSKRTTTISKQDNRNVDFLTSNLSKNPGTSPNNTNKAKPRSRGVSPLARSVQYPGFTDERPPNLKTDRSCSATRGRSVVNQNACSTPRQSCSPSVTRGVVNQNACSTPRQSCSPSVTRGRRPVVQEAKKGTQILGSKMVEKVMNARKSISSVDRRDMKQKLQGSETGGFARTTHREIKRA